MTAIADPNPFSDKLIPPDTESLKQALGPAFPLWQAIQQEVLRQYPPAIEEWHFPGQKYGWSFRMKDRKRALLYLLPRQGFFYVAFVFGEAATQTILNSTLAPDIRNELSAARPFAEGRGIRIPIYDGSLLRDIEELIRIKRSKT